MIRYEEISREWFGELRRNPLLPESIADGENYTLAARMSVPRGEHQSLGFILVRNVMARVGMYDMINPPGELPLGLFFQPAGNPLKGVDVLVGRTTGDLSVVSSTNLVIHRSMPHQGTLQVENVRNPISSCVMIAGVIVDNALEAPVSDRTVRVLSEARPAPVPVEGVRIAA